MAVGDAHLFPGFLTPVLTQLSCQSHRLLFSHTSAEMRGEISPERKFTSTGYRNHNHKVMSPTLSLLSHPSGQDHSSQHLNPFTNRPLFPRVCSTRFLKTLWEKEKLLVTSSLSFSHGVFHPSGETSTIFIKLKLSSANSFKLEDSKICRLGKSLLEFSRTIYSFRLAPDIILVSKFRRSEWSHKWLITFNCRLYKQYKIGCTLFLFDKHF